MWKTAAPQADTLPDRAQDPYGRGLGTPSRFVAAQGAPLRDGRRLTPEECEFLFIGGAGVSGRYLDGFRRAFEAGGIENVRIAESPDRTPGGRVAGLVGDMYGVPHINDVRFAKSLVGAPEVQAAAKRSRSMGDEQFNVGGYSYGAAAAAAQAYAVAESGGRVDNLVLIGAPINEDLYSAVKTHPNIGKVINVDLGEHGDPIRAGMTDAQFAAAFPKLVAQEAPSLLLGREKTGHFYYSGDGAEADRRRSDLVDMLTGQGLR